MKHLKDLDNVAQKLLELKAKYKESFSDVGSIDCQLTLLDAVQAFIKFHEVNEEFNETKFSKFVDENGVLEEFGVVIKACLGIQTIAMNYFSEKIKAKRQTND